MNFCDFRHHSSAIFLFVSLQRLPQLIPLAKPRGFGMEHDRNSPKAERVTDDCFAALVRSSKLLGYSAGTQDTWGRELNFAARPKCLGAASLQVIRPTLVQAYLDGLDGRTGKQAVAKAALIQLEKWAIVRDLVPRQIMLGAETGRPQGGHIPWTDVEVALASATAGPIYPASSRWPPIPGGADPISFVCVQQTSRHSRASRESMSSNARRTGRCECGVGADHLASGSDHGSSQDGGALLPILAAEGERNCRRLSA
jgi:hypothetical protein